MFKTITIHIHRHIFQVAIWPVMPYRLQWASLASQLATSADAEFHHPGKPPRNRCLSWWDSERDRQQSPAAWWDSVEDRLLSWWGVDLN